MVEKIKHQGFIQIPILIAIAIGVAITGGMGAAFIEYKNVSGKLAQSDQSFAEEKYDEAIAVLGLAQKSWLVNTLGVKSNLIKLKIEESKRGIVEEKLEKEQVSRGAAEQKAGQETQARKMAEGKTIEEASKRAAAEQTATNERLAKEQQQREATFQKERAGQEEKARILELAKTQPMIRAIVNGELKFYIYPLPSYAATGVSTVVEDTATDLSSWSPYGAKITRVYNSNGADITISWIRDYGSEILGQAIFRAHLEVGLGSNNCLADWRAFDSRTVKKILWHELGHSMGYGHSNNPNNIMYGVMDTRFEIESEISKVIPGGYFIAQPLCGDGGYSYGFQTDNPTTGFNLFVLPPGVDPKSFSEESSLSYSGCGAKRMQSYPGSCVVASGAKIYIENTSFSDAIKLSGKVINTDQSSWPDMTWDKDVYQYDTGELTKVWNLFH